MAGRPARLAGTVKTSFMYRWTGGWFLSPPMNGGGVGAVGKAFYKGGFEPKMTKKEASLILSLRYARRRSRSRKLRYNELGNIDKSIVNGL